MRGVPSDRRERTRTDTLWALSNVLGAQQTRYGHFQTFVTDCVVTHSHCKTPTERCESRAPAFGRESDGARGRGLARCDRAPSGNIPPPTICQRRTRAPFCHLPEFRRAASARMSDPSCWWDYERVGLPQPPGFDALRAHGVQIVEHLFPVLYHLMVCRRNSPPIVRNSIATWRQGLGGHHPKLVASIGRGARRKQTRTDTPRALSILGFPCRAPALPAVPARRLPCLGRAGKL